MSETDLDLSSLPLHVACVMDGNGRWAQARGLKRTEGHAAGEESLVDVVEGAVEIGLKWLTVYAFSTENWRRPVSEVRYLMDFNETLLTRRAHELHEQDVKIRFIGRQGNRVPNHLQERIQETEEMTRNNAGLNFTVAFNYGGRAEITDAVRALVTAGISGADVTDESLASYLYEPAMPDVDLMIRTSGEYRVSNFLLWQVAYSELVFTETLWPDFRRADLFTAIAEYQSRERRFGGLND